MNFSLFYEEEKYGQSCEVTLLEPVLPAREDMFDIELLGTIYRRTWTEKLLYNESLEIKRTSPDLGLLPILVWINKPIGSQKVTNPVPCSFEQNLTLMNLDEDQGWISQIFCPKHEQYYNYYIDTSHYLDVEFNFQYDENTRYNMAYQIVRTTHKSNDRMSVTLSSNTTTSVLLRIFDMRLVTSLVHVALIDSYIDSTNLPDFEFNRSGDEKLV